MNSKYVMDTFSQSKLFYSEEIQEYLKQGSAKKIIAAYIRRNAKTITFYWLYNNIYDCQPEMLKNMYRRIKRVLLK